MKYPNLASLLIEVYGLFRDVDRNGKYNVAGIADTVVFPVLGQPYVNSDGIQTMSFVYCFNAKFAGDIMPIFSAVGITPDLKFLFKYSINSIVSLAIRCSSSVGSDMNLS